MANINGTNGNDTLYGTTSDDLINGLAGDDQLYPNGGYDTLNGGSGKDKFVYEANLNSGTIIIPDFDGIGKGSNPSAEVIASVDTLQFTGDEQFTARNLLLTHSGNDLAIYFEQEFGFASTFFLQNFVLENLDNLAQVGNILFYGQTSITDSFDVFNANSTQSTIFKKNTVTFLNELDNNVNGFDNSDDVINGQGGNDKIDGLSGNDLLRGGMGNNTLIGGAGDDTLRAGSYSLGDNLLNAGDGNDSLSISDSYGKNTIEGGAGDDTLNASFSSGDNLLSGGDGNDFLISGAFGSNNTLNGGNGDDIFTTSVGGINNNILTGGGGKDKFVVYNFSYYSKTNNIITDFGGVNKNINPSTAVIAEVDTLNFQDDDSFFLFTAQNMLLTQNGNNLEITFAGTLPKGKLILENFALENLDNLSKSTGATVDLGNILFEGQTSITDSFDVFNANSTQNTVFKKNTVTFLNDLDNNVSGFDNSNDVINAQGGDDKIDGLSGNDLLRGGVGNNTLNGGTGDDSLNVDSSSGDNLLFGGDGNDSLFASGYQYYSSQYQEGDDIQGDDLRLEGNNTLNGGAGNDNLSASGSKGDNLLFGSDGNDSLSVSGYYSNPGGDFFQYYNNRTLGNNTLKGGAGDDTLSASGSAGDNLLCGGDGNDSLSVSGFIEYNYDSSLNSVSSGNNTLKGGVGDDTLDTSGSTGDNLLFGGDGNDFLYVSTPFTRSQYPPATSDLVTQTVDAGKGDDLLSVDYTFATGGITSTFDATTNSGSITAGNDRVNYKFIERFNILGTAYDDNIVGNSSNDRLSTGSGGKDTIDGGKGDDVLSVNYTSATGGVTSTFDATTNSGSMTAGNDRVSYKNIERFNISGTAYDDNIVGSNGNDTLFLGYDGNNSGKDTIDGGKGDDVLFSYYYYSDVSNTEGITSTFDATTNSGSITLGNNRVSYKNIEGLNIIGTFRPDNIVGSNGNDTLSGGYGYKNSSFYHELSDNDTLYGGDGIDTFFFHSINNNNEEGIDRVYDFNATNELIQVPTSFGGGLSIGSLKTSQFTLGTSATTSNQRFIYDFTTGALYFDSDGSADGFTQVQFAQLSPGLTLTENNFVVV
ncbi:calcium-binding protein [Nostoc sp.]|uniref:calcium-binding protein n=1 Tax=Nostoc sp. TaxID=1180 RepID=UPI002FF70272